MLGLAARRQRCTLILLFGTAVGICPCVAARLELKPSIGIAGAWAPGAWVPVSIKMRNNGPAFSGRLVISPFPEWRPWIPPEQEMPLGYYSLPVAVGADAAKTIRTQMQVPATQGDLRLRFMVVSNGQVLFSRILSLRQGERTAWLWVGWRRRRGDLWEEDGWASVKAVSAKELPNSWRDYSAVYGIVFDAVDLVSLSRDQEEAVLGWIARGGRALVTMPCARMNPNSPFIERLVGVRVVGEETISKPTALEDYFSRRVRQDIARARVIRCSVRGAKVLLAQNGIPLLIVRHMVYGSAVLCAFDPSEITFGPRGRERDFARDLSGVFDVRDADDDIGQPSIAYLGGGERGEEYGYCPPSASISLVPREARTRGLWKGTVAYLVIFLLGMGPINYLVLWKTRKKEWLLATVPAAVVVLSCLAFAFARAMHSKEPTVTYCSVNVVRLGEDWLHSTVFMGVLSPAVADYNVAFPDPGVAFGEIGSGGG